MQVQIWFLSHIIYGPVHILSHTSTACIVCCACQVPLFIDLLINTLKIFHRNLSRRFDNKSTPSASKVYLNKRKSEGGDGESACVQVHDLVCACVCVCVCVRERERERERLPNFK